MRRERRVNNPASGTELKRRLQLTHSQPPQVVVFSYEPKYPQVDLTPPSADMICLDFLHGSVSGAADTNRSLPDLISVIDRNNGRSQTMKQTYYVCPCRITLVWMALTEPPTKSLFCGLCQRVAMPGVAGTLSNHVGTFSIKD
ncbi:hypothetical protein F2P81_002262 [Scophthalmus maximus]|uniref:Uncharacterized protein n=1 Tax=Scophthalmus maximus TaxID=52904 RepID=A0A6A4TIB7_SCOMX|nr:hypothetical protein F2P81_002262 [Scophthalmus maximus]